MISGGAGFIGTNLAVKLINENEKVLSIDNFSGGRSIYPASLNVNSNFEHIELDLSERSINRALLQIESTLVGQKYRVWHLAANSDIQKGATDSFFDYKDTLGTTLTMLELSRNHKPTSFIFASSSAVYGDHNGVRTSESVELKPISNYGNMKLSSEIAIQNILGEINIPYFIFRFPNVIGTPLTHGLIHDVYKKLIKKPPFIEILGDGLQQKPYVHVDDLLAVIFSVTKSQPQGIVLNIGPTDDGITVAEIVNALKNSFSPQTNLLFGNSKQGWVGDIPQYKLDVSQLSSSFNTSELSSRKAVQKVILELLEDHN